MAGNSRSATSTDMTSMTHDGPQITGGVDTHGLTHHAAAIDATGRCPFRGRHAPVGRVDKTVTGLLRQAPVKSQTPVRPRAW